MKPHALRRILWIGSLVAGAGVAAVGSHYWFDVREATAGWIDRPAGQTEKRWLDMAQAYSREGAALAAEGTRPQGPVDQKRLESTFLRYANRNPRWFPFVGPPVPPEIKPEPTRPVVAAPVPTGLEAIGEPVLVMSRTLSFKFKDVEAPVAVRVGEIIRANESDPARFRLLALEEVDISSTKSAGEAARPLLATKIVYEVLDTSGEREGEPRFLLLKPPYDPKLGTIIEGGIEQVATSASPEGVTAPDGATAGAGPDGVVVPVPGGDARVEPSGSSESVEVSTELTRPVEELRQEDLRPRVIEYSDTQRAVVFDRNTFEYVRNRGESIAETVKTEEAVDRSTGRVIGVRITGFGGDAPVSALDVRKGDILKSINGRPVTSRAQAIEIGKTLKDDTNVSVVIERDGRDINYVVDPRDPRTRRAVRYFDVPE